MPLRRGVHTETTSSDIGEAHTQLQIHVAQQEERMNSIEQKIDLLISALGKGNSTTPTTPTTPTTTK